MRFRTKVDWWVAAAIALALLLGPIAVFATREWAWLALVLISDIVIVLVCWPCDYTLGEKGLLIRSGVVRWKVPYDQIDRVYPTRSPISSPAWSLDRLAIAYGKKWVMVSPEDHRAFVTKLGQLAGLSQRGLELYREDKAGH
jgi:hypothetical protein